MQLDRPPDDRAGPAAADSSGTAPADLPVIPNGRSRLPHHHPDSTEVRSRPESVSDYRAKVDATYMADAIDRGCDRVRKTEENAISPEMRRLEPADSDRHLIGWEHSSSLYAYERGAGEVEFYEISEDEANQIVERIRRTVTGQG